jgi:hypothetical protein
MVKRKIGLAGKSGSGKDLIADHISVKYGYRKMAVADAIRTEAGDWLTSVLKNASKLDLPPNFNLVVEAFRTAVWAKPTSPEMRVFLQFWGIEFRRNQNSEYWTNKLAANLDNHEQIVISDIRTPDEVEVVRNAGGEVWFVERPGVGSVGITNHYTEIALEGAKFDRKVQNEGTIQDLFEAVDWYMKES